MIGQKQRKVKEVKMPVVFDHEAETMMCKDGVVRHLLQNDHKFTYAEFNRFTKLWEPQPEHLGRMQIFEKNLLPEVEGMSKIVRGVLKKLEEMTELLREGDGK